MRGGVGHKKTGGNFLRWGSDGMVLYFEHDDSHGLYVLIKLCAEKGYILL